MPSDSMLDFNYLLRSNLESPLMIRAKLTKSQLSYLTTHTHGVNSLPLIMFDSSFLGQQRLLIPREDFWLFPEISLRRASHGRLVASPGMVMKPSLCLSHLLALHTPPRLIELLPSH